MTIDFYRHGYTRAQPVLLDFESRSRADLRVVGGRRYWDHPSSEVLCCAWHDTESGVSGVWLPGDPAPYWVGDGSYLAAHNAMGFDRFAAVRLWGEACAKATRWIDTSELARRAGLPGALDALGTLWLNLPKDKVASKFTKGLSSARRPTKKTATETHPELTPAEWKALSKQEKRERGVLPALTDEALSRVYDYCVSDVEILVHGWPLLQPWLDFELENEVLFAERAVNDRGVCFDRELARALIKADTARAKSVVVECAERLDMPAAELRSIAKSPEKFTARTGLPDAQQRTLEDALARADLDGAIRGCAPGAAWVIRARQALASIARGKLEAGLARCSDDGRLRDSHRYIGAHTWRWAGRGMQLQNMPRPSKELEGVTEDDLEALVEACLEGLPLSGAEIDILLRATLCARPGYTLIDADFTGIESRVLAYMARDPVAIDTIENGRDPYKIAASGIFGVAYDQITKPQRQAGKVAVLACGYGGGSGAIERFAAKEGIILASAGVTGEDVVRGWRAIHKPITEFWWRLEDYFRAAVEFDEPTAIDDLGFEYIPAADGSGDVALWMPSGRPLVYSATRAGEKGKFGKRSLSYRGAKGREHTYGGKLVENLVQSFCREFLAWALAAAEDAGLNPVAHVHDQLICEVPERDGPAELERLLACMTRDLPDWAEGYPIAADGHVGRRHRK